MTNDNFGTEQKSKSQIKDEMHELQVLGEALLALPLSVYETFPVPEELNNAIADARKISAHGGKRRQLQFIGKIMRTIDAEPLQQAYAAWQTGNKKMAREHQHLEELREQLLANNKNSFEQLIEQFPTCDIQQLRQLIRLAQQEKSQAKPPKNYRKLFQFLKDLHST